MWTTLENIWSVGGFVECSVAAFGHLYAFKKGGVMTRLKLEVVMKTHYTTCVIESHEECRRFVDKALRMGFIF